MRYVVFSVENTKFHKLPQKNTTRTRNCDKLGNNSAETLKKNIFTGLEKQNIRRLSVMVRRMRSVKMFFDIYGKKKSIIYTVLTLFYFLNLKRKNRYYVQSYNFSENYLLTLFSSFWINIFLRKNKRKQE